MAVNCRPEALQIKSNPNPFHCFTPYDCFPSKTHKKAADLNSNLRGGGKKGSKHTNKGKTAALKTQRGLGRA